MSSKQRSVVLLSSVLLCAGLVLYLHIPANATDLPRNVEADLVIDCNSIYGYAIDRNNPDEILRYKIFVQNVGSSTYTALTTQDFTPEDGTFNDGMDGRAIFGSGSTRHFLFRIYDTTDFNEDSIGIAEREYDETIDCMTDHKPSLDLGMTCDAVYIGTLFDRNMGAQGVRYDVSVFDNRGANITGTPKTYGGTGSRDLAFYFVPDLVQDAKNDGYTAFIRISNVMPDGKDAYSGGSGGAAPGQVSPIYDESGGVYTAAGPGDYVFKREVGPCFDATCSIEVTPNFPGAPPNSELADSNYEVKYTFTNTGQGTLYSSIPTGHNLVAVVPYVAPNGSPPPDYKDTGGYKGEAVPDNIAPGESYEMTFTVDGTPGITPNIGTRNLNIYLYYQGMFSFGTDCSVNVDFYKPFTLTPYSNPPAGWNAEERETIDFNSGVTEGTPPATLPATVTATTTRSFTITRGGITTDAPSSKILYDPSDNPEAHDYIPNFLNRPIGGKYLDLTTLRSLQAGDEYCINIEIDRHTGYIGPHGPDNVIGAVSMKAPFCSTVVDEPYVRTYGTDVAAGGQFGTDGRPGSGKVNAYTRRGSEFGSGAEFGLMALDAVNGFPSANLRTSALDILNKLTFSNDTSLPPTGCTPNITLGSLGGAFACSRPVTDYYQETRLPETGTAPNGAYNAAAANSLVSGTQSWGTGPFTLTNPNLGNIYNKRHTLYVDGDVIIKNDIIYKDADSGWTNLSDIPNFSLIVKGNIYIDAGVTQLDGLYVAQPKDVADPVTGVMGHNNDPTSGRIYTCATGTTPVPAVNLYTACHQKLTVNGAFVAQEVKLLRTAGTLSERPTIAPASGGTPSLGLTWHNSGNPKDPAKPYCVNLADFATPNAAAWNDNFICSATDYQLTYHISYTTTYPKAPDGTPYASRTGTRCVYLVHDNYRENQPPGASYAHDDNALCSGNTDMFWEVRHDQNTTKECLWLNEPLDATWNAKPLYLCFKPAKPAIPTQYTKEWFFQVPGKQPDYDIDKAAESFNLGPEVYLSRPVFKPISSESNGTYDYFVALPPIL